MSRMTAHFLSINILNIHKIFPHRESAWENVHIFRKIGVNKDAHKIIISHIDRLVKKKLL